MDKLPHNIIGVIAIFLDIRSIYHFGMTCKKYSKILSNELVWKENALKEVGPCPKGE
jgi:hypothetical protein